jgi:hypothetical protein
MQQSSACLLVKPRPRCLPILLGRCCAGIDERVRGILLTSQRGEPGFAVASTRSQARPGPWVCLSTRQSAEHARCIAFSVLTIAPLARFAATRMSASSLTLSTARCTRVSRGARRLYLSHRGCSRSHKQRLGGHVDSPAVGMGMARSNWSSRFRRVWPGLARPV